MDRQQSLTELMGQFPTSDNVIDAMHWLAKVFRLWTDEPEGEVLGHRHTIAERLGAKYRLLPNPSMEPLSYIEPGDSAAARRILTWGATALAFDDQATSARRHFYLVCVQRWKGEID